MSERVLFMVNHLMGAGHLARALNLARDFAANGFEAHILTGGFPAPQFDSAGITLHQMPPIRSDGTNFAKLLTLDGTPVTEAYHNERIAFAQSVLKTIKPQLLVLELFPFGRRSLKAEYLEVLEFTDTLNTRPKIVVSVRDILSPPSKPSKVTFAENVIRRWVDTVLVHSEEHVVALDKTWPISDELRPKIRYSGFVAPPLTAARSTDGTGEILVSTGSGSFADRVFDTALDAARSPFGVAQKWRLLLGRPDPDRLTRYRSQAPSNVRVEPARSDYRDLLQNAAAAVCLTGYNASMDLLQSKARCVIVPYDEDSETEQRMRSDALVDLPGIERVLFDDLSPTTLVDALSRVLEEKTPRNTDIRFDGAAVSATICRGLLNN